MFYIGMLKQLENQLEQFTYDKCKLSMCVCIYSCLYNDLKHSTFDVWKNGLNDICVVNKVSHLCSQ